MSFISEKSKQVPGSMIRKMFAMQTGMTDVVSFALGEPDFTAPQHVIDAAVASLRRGETHYTPNAGIPALREAVAKSYQARGLDYKPSEILIGAGAISLLNLACTAILDIGDEVIVPDPGWANYKGLMMQVGAVPVPVSQKEENGFMYDPEDIRAALTPRTKVILINSPSNPTGAVASAENLRQIAELVVEKNLYVLTDEIYRELLWDDEPYTSIASFPGMKERTVIVDGFSKTYAMTGMRLAYSAAPEDVTMIMTRLLENVLSSVRGFAKGRTVALFGCGGDRDKAKRPKMGKIACDIADFVVVTTDNPRTEVPGDIIREILAGMEGTKTPYIVVEDRIEAIHWAMDHARAGDIIVLCGKGHETYQEVGHVKHHMDEREIVADYLKK